MLYDHTANVNRHIQLVTFGIWYDLLLVNLKFTEVYGISVNSFRRK